MKNTTYKIDVQSGAFSRLFRTPLNRADLPMSIDTLIGFLTTDGRWDTRLSQLLMIASVGSSPAKILSYGVSSEGGYASEFHQPVGKLPPNEILGYKGQAIYVKASKTHAPTFGYAFENVVWGIVKEPTDVRSALARALILSAAKPLSGSADAPVHLVLPLYGTVGTIVQNPIFNEDDRLHLARTLVYEQVQGLRLATRYLERPVHVTVLVQSEVIDWMGLFARSAKQAHLADFADLRYISPL